MICEARSCSLGVSLGIELSQPGHQGGKPRSKSGLSTCILCSVFRTITSQESAVDQDAVVYPKELGGSSQGQPSPEAYGLLRLWLYEKNDPMSMMIVEVTKLQ